MADVAASSLLTNFLGTTATVTTIGQFLSGMYVLYRTTPTVQNIHTHILKLGYFYLNKCTHMAQH